MKEKLARRCYRLGLAAAKQRYLSAALRYAQCACILDSENDDAAHLAEICRYELGDYDGEEQAYEQAVLLVKQKKWLKAARSLSNSRQSVRLLAIRGCLWALAKRRALAADCFAEALAKDRGNILAGEALAKIDLRRKSFWRFF